ncbi:hypothetical protein J6590_074570 [Homalodisca vitripennis]|nr:hypothetical protein J6590_074570 [Homalodisca vitripennis]
MPALDTSPILAYYLQTTDALPSRNRRHRNTISLTIPSFFAFGCYNKFSSNFLRSIMPLHLPLSPALQVLENLSASITSSESKRNLSFCTRAQNSIRAPLSPYPLPLEKPQHTLLFTWAVMVPSLRIPYYLLQTPEILNTITAATFWV